MAEDKGTLGKIGFGLGVFSWVSIYVFSWFVPRKLQPNNIFAPILDHLSLSSTVTIGTFLLAILGLSLSIVQLKRKKKTKIASWGLILNLVIIIIFLIVYGIIGRITW